MLAVFLDQISPGDVLIRPPPFTAACGCWDQRCARRCNQRVTVTIAPQVVRDDMSILASRILFFFEAGIVTAVIAPKIGPAMTDVITALSTFIAKRRNAPLNPLTKSKSKKIHQHKNATTGLS